MGTQQAKLDFPERSKEALQREWLLSSPVVEELIRDFQPALLHPCPESDRVLGLIIDYLKNGKKSNEDLLRKELPEPLLESLHGLRWLLTKTNLNMATWMLEEHQRQYGLFLKEEIESLQED